MLFRSGREQVHLDLRHHVAAHRDVMRVRKRGASYVLSLRLPFVERADLNVFRRADELFIRVGSYKRNLALPQSLQRLDVQDASFVEDRLEVRFARESGGRATAAAGMRRQGGPDG